MEFELKPCPFCGSEHIALNSNHAKPLYSIDCEDCGCGTRGQLTPKIAADVWNKRVARTDEIKLKPCPFCNGKLIGILRRAGGHRVICRTCGAMGGMDEVIDDAVEAWNERGYS